MAARASKPAEIAVAVAETAPVAHGFAAGSGPGDRLHEDLALFRSAEQELRGLIERTETALDRGSAHGRRLARLRTVLEDAMLQARQGAHEAHYNQ